jgi:hypothetical protein
LLDQKAACDRRSDVRRKLVVIGCMILLSLGSAEAFAQRHAVPRGRHPVAAPRHYPRYYSRYYYRPFYYSSFYYPGFSFSLYYSSYWPYYRGWYGYPYAYRYGYPYAYYDQYPYPYPYPYPGPYYYDYNGSARLDVEPRNAEVFVDGYFVGVVDDFDGWLQRLHVVPGEHEIEIYLQGYRTYREKVLFRPGQTLKIEHTLQPLAPGETPEPRPTTAGREPPPQPEPRRGDPYPERRRGEEPIEAGGVAVRVQPPDAEVLIDGERWEAPAGGQRLVVRLSEGEHQIEIRKEGYRTFTTTVRIQRGETVPLNVSLSRQ